MSGKKKKHNLHGNRHINRSRFVVLAVLVVLVAVTAVSYTFWDSIRVEPLSDRDRLLATIDAKIKEFQQGVIRAQQSPSRLRGHRPQIKPLAGELKRLLGRFETEYGDSVPSELEDLTLRLAQAAIASSQLRFRDALALVTEEDEQAATKRTLDVLWCRAANLFALQEWSAAREHYEKILEKQAESLAAKNQIAICLAQVGDAQNALKRFDESIDKRSRWLKEESSRDVAAELAGSFFDRGTTWRWLEKFPQALQDFNRSVKLYTTLVQAGRQELAQDLAYSLNARGAILLALRKTTDQSLRNHDQAVSILAPLVEQEGRDELADELAASFSYRGTMLRAMGKIPLAFNNQNRSVAIYTDLVEEQGRSDLNHKLAMVFDSRGNVLQLLGKLTEALTDHDRAVEIYTRLVDEQGRNELEDDLTRSLQNRCIALIQMRELKAALADIDKAIEIRGRLVERSRDGPGEGRHRSELESNLQLREEVQRRQSAGGDK